MTFPGTAVYLVSYDECKRLLSLNTPLHVCSKILFVIYLVLLLCLLLLLLLSPIHVIKIFLFSLIFSLSSLTYFIICIIFVISSHSEVFFSFLQVDSVGTHLLSGLVAEALSAVLWTPMEVIKQVSMASFSWLIFTRFFFSKTALFIYPVRIYLFLLFIH